MQATAYGQRWAIVNGAIPLEFASLDYDNSTSDNSTLLLQPSKAETIDIPDGFCISSIQIKGEQIVQICDTAEPDSYRLDASGCIVLPGFIDIHVHGGMGHDVMDASWDALNEMASFFAQQGVSSFLPTTLTASHADTLRAVTNAQEAINQQRQRARPTGARILGVHLEGPYISPQYPGAQPASAIRPPNPAEFDALLAAGTIRMITLAPEQPDVHELIEKALTHNVVVVVGHSAATYAECEAAIALGMTQATHTYNAMTGLHHREPGVLGSVLSNDGVYAQLIADHIHVHPAAIKILAHCKGNTRTILITDAMRAAGMEPGEYDLGGQSVTVKDGSCRLADGTLAGSILTMDQALRNFMAATGLSLAETWPTSSRTPAQSLGLESQIGAIKPGLCADLVLLDAAQFQVVATVVGGEIVYLREPERLVSSP